MANSADPDLLASSEANRSGSTLFAKAEYIQAQQDRVSKHQSFFISNREFCHLLFVCVEVLWPSQPIRAMLSAVSLPKHMFPGHT